MNRLRDKNTVIIIVLSIVLILAFIVFIVRPSLIGYGIYQQVKDSSYSIDTYAQEIEDLQSELLVSKTNLTSTRQFSEDLLRKMEAYSDKLAECKSELSALKVESSTAKSKCESDTSRLNEKISELEGKVQDLTEQYNALALNTANNLCCKAKVDNPDINYYDVQNNRVICLEEGTLGISC